MKNNEASKSLRGYLLWVVMLIIVICFFTPIVFIIINSFKGKLFIAEQPFSLPTGEMFVGLENYMSGIEKTGFFTAFGYSSFITVFSVLGILLCTSMSAWYIIRAKNKIGNIAYYAFVFSMVVPFQMIMYTVSKMADTIGLNNPIGMVILYIGFGSGLSIFMFCGFVKSIPLEIEEAAMIDGCNTMQVFFQVTMPILKPIAMTVAILNAMWVWNDYLLPYLVIGLSTEYKTIPVVIQYLQGTYGAIDYGAFMAMLVVAIIPIIIFYAICQKYIIEGVVAGAVKG